MVTLVVMVAMVRPRVGSSDLHSKACNFLHVSIRKLRQASKVLSMMQTPANEERVLPEMP